MFSKDKAIEIFCIVDDFTKEFESRIKDMKLAQLATDKQHRNRALSMSYAEILTILICFHLGTLVAYCFFPKKLSLNIEEIKTNQLFLTAA